MQSQLVTCPAAGCGQLFLHLATEQAQVRYSRHIVLMLLEDPNNAVKAATLQRVGRIILWPAPQFTDFAKMARLAHWTQAGVPPYAQLLSRPACQEVATTLVAGLKGQAISALVEMVVAKGIGGQQTLLLLDEVLGQLVALLCQSQLALGPKAGASNGMHGVNQGPGRPTSAQHQAQGCLAPAGPQEPAGVLEEQQSPGAAAGPAPRARDAAQGKPTALRQGLSQEVACTKLRAAVAAGLQPPARPAPARTWLWRWSPFAAKPAPGAAPTPVQLPASPGVVLKTLPLLV
ncbi:hypothetical protein QJQ45_016197 [Haematococcus lacustris]|nr:hypothetical protein QJQ45_016197 [Haematococcus lacustris]